MKKMQTCQSTALRTITECFLMSGIEHLHNEACIFPIRGHNQLLSEQFLLGCFRRNHSFTHFLRAEPPPRKVKRTFVEYVDAAPH